MFCSRRTPQKDMDFSIGELFRNRKRHGSKDDDKPPLKMSSQILHQVGNDLGIEEAKDLAVNELLAEKIDHAYFESLADNTKLRKTMKENQHASNIMVKPPKLNLDIESCHQFQSNTFFLCLMKKVNTLPIIFQSKQSQPCLVSQNLFSCHLTSAPQVDKFMM